MKQQRWSSFLGSEDLPTAKLLGFICCFQPQQITNFHFLRKQSKATGPQGDFTDTDLITCRGTQNRIYLGKEFEPVLNPFMSQTHQSSSRSFVTLEIKHHVSPFHSYSFIFSIKNYSVLLFHSGNTSGWRFRWVNVPIFFPPLLLHTQNLSALATQGCLYL